MLASIFSLNVIQTALELGCIYALVALALFLSYSILNIADLSTDGCFTLGCAVACQVALTGHPFLALLAAMAAGIASSDAAATRSAIDELIDRWHQRDAQTVAVVEKALEAMASVIASTINVCDVDVVMLGGLWARFEPELIRRIERMVRPQVLAYPEVEASVLVADIVDRPALMGAAEIGLRRFIDNPLRFMKQN